MKIQLLQFLNFVLNYLGVSLLVDMLNKIDGNKMFGSFSFYMIVFFINLNLIGTGHVPWLYKSNIYLCLIHVCIIVFHFHFHLYTFLSVTMITRIQ